MKNYAAITIGPIVETISNVSTPGALWCASGMFSNITGSLCEKILKKFPDVRIISPAYNKALENKDIKNDGIGRWHDRIFFCTSVDIDFICDMLSEISKEVKNELAENIAKAIEASNVNKVKDYIRDYIQINWVTASSDIAEADGKNCILNLSKYLDSMELSANFTYNETDSPLAKLFNGKAESKNHFIKNCWLIPENKDVQLLNKKGNIRDISDIANPLNINDSKKSLSYFAIVQSDGDGIGKCLEGCEKPDDVEAFSDACIKYTGAAAKLIGEYGGLTVYAGGDDLLFIAPLEGINGGNIFTLCKNITNTFKNSFEEFNQKRNCFVPTLSFGISVNFTSSPLYEAVKEVFLLLTKDAKSGEKNKIALSLHKHSGQSVKFVAPNRWDYGAPLFELEKLIDKNAETTKDNDETLKSVLYMLDTFKDSYELCRERNIDTKFFFENTFDNAGQSGSMAYINAIKAFGDVVASDKSCKAYDIEKNNGALTDKETCILNAMLRFVKLYSERGDGN